MAGRELPVAVPISAEGKGGLSAAHIPVESDRAHGMAFHEDFRVRARLAVLGCGHVREATARHYDNVTVEG